MVYWVLFVETSAILKKTFSGFCSKWEHYICSLLIVRIMYTSNNIEVEVYPFKIQCGTLSNKSAEIVLHLLCYCCVWFDHVHKH